MLPLEAAMYVVSTRSIEEARSVFTEGLEAVVSVAAAGENMVTMNMMDLKEMKYLEELQLQGLRDVASAPF
ncbi:hypothetical protein CRYUN_Cryun17cG0072500 [Craigia yunnanensis]